MAGSDLETENLIQKADNFKQHKETWKLKYGVIVPILFAIFLGEEMINYLLPEWTQFKIRNELFPNSTSVKRFSGCNATNHSDPLYMKYTTVQQATAQWNMYKKIAANIPTFFANLILPSYTDTYGRRFLFILAAAGLFIKALAVAVVVYVNQHLIYVVAAYAIEGMTGAGYALSCSCFSYVADITVSENHRVLGILILEATLMVTATIAAIVTGVIIEAPSLGYRYTSIIGTAIIATGLGAAVAFLPETLKKNKTKPVSARALETVRRTVAFYISEVFKGMRTRYITLLLAFYFTAVASTNQSSIQTIYLLGQPFCWGPAQIGYFVFAQQISWGMIGPALVKLFQKCASSELIAIISTVSTIASFIIESFATTDIMMYSVAVVGVFSFIVIPMIRGMMSTVTPPNRQGGMFASVAVVQILSSVTGALLVNKIYSTTLSIMNGFVFLVLAGVTFIDFMLLVSNYYLKIYRDKLPN